MVFLQKKYIFVTTKRSQPMKYDVFISYSRKDTPIADQICAAFDRAGISFEKIYVEDNEDLARELSLRQAPTLVEVKAGNAEKFVNVVAIKSYIQNKTQQTG